MLDAHCAPVLDRLKDLLDHGRLPPRAAAAARRLADRLAAPVRVAVLGSPGAGKTTVCNALAGTGLVPPGLRLPSTLMVYRDAPRMVLTLGDGTTEAMDGADLETALARRPCFIELGAPVPALRRLSLLEVVTNNLASEIAGAARWAARQADIAVWVARGYDEGQQAAWRQVPRKLRDHGFLAETNANGVSRPVEGFLSAHVIANLDTTALVQAVEAHAEAGRQADTDGALLFLSRFEPSVAAPKTADQGGALSRFAQPELCAAGPEGAALAATALREGVGALAEDIAQDPGTIALFPTRCAEIVDALQSFSLPQNAERAVSETADFLVLLQLEGGPAAAEEAAIALLQLRRALDCAAGT